MPETGSAPLHTSISNLVAQIKRILSGEDDSDSDAGSEAGYDAYDVEMHDITNSTSNTSISGIGSPTTSVKILQRDFIETVALGSSYRPGVTPFGTDDLTISISVPVITLASSGAIPPRALMAWDTHLLSRRQYLVLIINNVRKYPILDGSGKGGEGVNFKVGLSGRYKPTRINIVEARRNFGLVEKTDDAADIKGKKRQSFSPDEDISLEPEDPEDDPIESDPGRFNPFALSATLESLMDARFFSVVRVRIQFSLGWAGAEECVSISEKEQMRVEDVYQRDKYVSRDRNLRSFHRILF